MPLFRKTLIILSILTSFSLTGCQHIVKSPVQSTSQPSAPAGNEIDSNRNFNLQGKIGVKTPEQSGSAFYTWVQNEDQFEIQLTGILGLGKTVIEGSAEQVTLNSSKTGEITANNPEELLKRATGWTAPITHIVDWVQARPATPGAQTVTDELQRTSQIAEDGWQVTLNYADKSTLPNKLILKQQLENGQENRITMLIQNR